MSTTRRQSSSVVAAAAAAASVATERNESADPPREKKSVCYRCRKGIPRGLERSVVIWSVSNRQERVTICAPCAIPPQPSQPSRIL